jgi:hypothetical protein
MVHGPKRTFVGSKENIFIFGLLKGVMIPADDLVRVLQ